VYSGLFSKRINIKRMRDKVIGYALLSFVAILILGAMCFKYGLTQTMSVVGISVALTAMIVIGVRLIVK
jgi:hypothetical protein